MWQVPDRWVEPSPCFVTLPELVACADVVQANDWRIFVLATAATATATSTAIWLWKAVEDQYLQRNFVRKLQSSRVHLDHNCPGSIQDRFDIYIYTVYIYVCLQGTLVISLSQGYQRHSLGFLRMLLMHIQLRCTEELF